MAKTLSTMLPLGTHAADFNLPEPASGINKTLADCRGEQGLLVMFICNHCPYVIHIEDALIELFLDYQNSGIGIVAISANDVKNYPQDSPEKMAEKNYPFSYLYDASQTIAKAYNAVCTPDFFLFDQDLKLVYRGQFDDSRPANGLPVTGDDLRAAMDSLLNHKAISGEQKPSMGCNIKWKV